MKQQDALLDEALLAIITDAMAGRINHSRALEEIKQAFDYHRKEEKPA